MLAFVFTKMFLLFKIWLPMRIIYEGIISAVYTGQGFVCFSSNSRLSSNCGDTFVVCFRVHEGSFCSRNSKLMEGL